MKVRGAPLIGAAAAYGVALGLIQDATTETLDRILSLLAATRPTAINLRWALERMGVLLLEGTEDAAITDSFFTRIDGNAVFLSGYNRRAAVLRNEFSLLGQNAIASWGRSVDYDGTGGQQPRHFRLGK